MKIFSTNDVREIATVMNRGEVVALPTDTVYGVAARLDNPDGVARLFDVKRRPNTVPLPVFVKELVDIVSLGTEIDESELAVLEALWPGPLTLAIRSAPFLAERVGSSDGTIGIRCPNDPFIHELVRWAGPLAVTSANEHGEPPCRSVEEIAAAFGNESKLYGVVDGGFRDGAVSTVARVRDGDVTILREGAISEVTLRALAATAR